MAQSGKIYLVGIGPGDASLMTPKALAALQACDTLVAYSGYAEQVKELLAGKEVAAMRLGQELERAAYAVERAAAGRVVAVVSSGDAGVYGMAGPVFRVLTDQGWDGQNPAVEVIPGVSAMQAAAAALGSPLMQDFCAISLSDLLTPWETIRRRIEAAALGDFVVAFYNPKSQKRDWQLREARRILLERRPGSTPVGLVRDATRPDQTVTVTDLEHLEGLLDKVDMFTLALVGNSATYVHQGKIITPRGYEEKARRG